MLALYAKGAAVRDIQVHLNQLYGIEVSPTRISNVTNRSMPLIREWQSSSRNVQLPTRLFTW